MSQIKQSKTSIIRSNIALEVSKTLVKNKDYTKSHKTISKGVCVDITEILTQSASNSYGLTKGSYVLVSMPFDTTLKSALQDIITKEIKNGLQLLLKKIKLEKPKSVLVVGLGNPKMLADSFGSQVIEKVFASSSVVLPKSLSKKQFGIDCSVSKFSCNVFGQNGIESFDIIKGVVDITKPDLVILIDTLVAGSAKRLCSNIQLANVGIIPGSGVNNARKELSQKTLKTKVITIGMPLVVYASDIVRQYIEKYTQNFSEKLTAIKDLVVMPREIETQLSLCSKILARAINLALNPNFSEKEFEKYFS